MENLSFYKSIMGCIALLGITISCTNEYDTNQFPQAVSITAIMPSLPTTRLAYDDQLGDDGLGDINVTWTAGDAFVLEDGTTVFTIPEEGTDGTTASFTGTYSGDLNGKTVYFPADGHINSITYFSQEQDGDNSLNHLSKFNRMVGTITGNAETGYTVTFEQKSFIVKLNLTIQPDKEIKEITFASTDFEEYFKSNLNATSTKTDWYTDVKFINSPTSGKVTAYIMMETNTSDIPGIYLQVTYVDESNEYVQLQSPVTLESGKAYLVEATIQ